jgi:hypothetical protein
MLVFLFLCNNLGSNNFFKKKLMAPHNQPENIKEARVLKVRVFILEIEVEFYI